VEKCVKRTLAGNAMPSAGDADGDRERHRAAPRGVKTRERRTWPGGARRVEESAALRRRLQEALLRRHESGGKLGDGAQGRIVLRGDRAASVNKENRVAKAAAFAERDSEPCPQRRRILDVAGLDRPFDAA